MRYKSTIVGFLFMAFLITNCSIVNASQFYAGRGHNNRIYTALKSKLNLTDKDLEEARLKGKTAFDLANERGISEEGLREYIKNQAVNSIDSIMSKGLMPRTLGERIKKKAILKISTWNGQLN